MSEFLTVLLISIVVGVIVSRLTNRRDKKASQSGRLPHVTASPRISYDSSIAPRSAPLPRPAGRKPRLASDREYMDYRNCPDCHSENTLQNQVIYKVAPHQFVCRVCGKRFKF